mgnify:CR=1 FL=1|tara:strand:- start:49 stop:273 length:225 start_codon:yes stop_codon:yes gene_type:complete
MTSDNEVLNELSRIVDIITPILIDIKDNTSKDNIQTNAANKKQLKQIALKLKLLKEDIITLMHPNKTKQTKLFD